MLKALTPEPQQTTFKYSGWVADVVSYWLSLVWDFQLDKSAKERSR
jgi:hypothetical protein